MDKKINTSFSVWIWPITILLAFVIVIPMYLAYGWLLLGNKIIDKTIGKDSPFI